MLTCNVRLIKRSAAVAFTLKVPPESLFTPQVTFAFRPSFLRAARTPQSGRTAASRTDWPGDCAPPPPAAARTRARGGGMASLGAGLHVTRRRGAGRSAVVERRNLLTVCRWESLTFSLLMPGGWKHVTGRICWLVIWKWTLGVCVWGYSSGLHTNAHSPSVQDGPNARARQWFRVSSEWKHSVVIETISLRYRDGLVGHLLQRFSLTQTQTHT